METKGYVYKFTHKESGKYYIGSHNGKCKSYKGGGLIWRHAVNKYGIESYIKEILYEGDDYRNQEEYFLNLYDAKNDPKSYNLKNEAIGGTFFGEDNGMFGKKHSDETKRKIGDRFRGKKRPDHSEKMKGENNPMFGRNDQIQIAIKKAKENIGKTFEEIFGEDKALEIKQKLSKAQLGKKKQYVSNRQHGGNNISAKRILFRGVEYDSIKQAMDILNLSRYVIKKECIELPGSNFEKFMVK